MNALVLVDKPVAGIAVLTLNRPEKRNSLSIALMKEFCQRMEELAEERVIIINGAGSCFCSGMFLDEVLQPEYFHEQASLVAKTLTLIYQATPVTIASVHGFAVAGGAGLMAACDFVVAEQFCQFGFPEVHIGLVPAQVMAVLKRQLKFRDLRELLLRGNLISAQDALRMGLISEVVSETDPFAEAMMIAMDIIKGGPKAIRQTKHLLEDLSDSSFEEDLQKARDFHLEGALPAEAQEGIAAWKERRNPSWV
jgi:methylglutaconyl-CoA hydratase